MCIMWTALWIVRWAASYYVNVVAQQATSGLMLKITDYYKLPKKKLKLVKMISINMNILQSLQMMSNNLIKML